MGSSQIYDVGKRLWDHNELSEIAQLEGFLRATVNLNPPPGPTPSKLVLRESTATVANRRRRSEGRQSSPPGRSAAPTPTRGGQRPPWPVAVARYGIPNDHDQLKLVVEINLELMNFVLASMVYGSPTLPLSRHSAPPKLLNGGHGRRLHSPHGAPTSACYPCGSTTQLLPHIRTSSRMPSSWREGMGPPWREGATPSSRELREVSIARGAQCRGKGERMWMTYGSRALVHGCQDLKRKKYRVSWNSQLQTKENIFANLNSELNVELKIQRFLEMLLVFL